MKTKMKIIFRYTFIIGLFIANSIFAQSNNPLNDILYQNPDLFSAILNHPQKKEIQILYTQINRDKNNKPHFKTYSFNLNDEHYFYPASTIKLPVAIFALEKLNELDIDYLDKNTSLKIDSNYTRQTKVTEDSSSKSGQASIANYIKKVLLVSDNDAFNRLYEFTDRQTINKKLNKYGFKDSRIISRLSVGDKDETAKYTNAINFYKDNQLVYTKPIAYDNKNYPLKLTNLKRGRGYLDGKGKLVSQPFDFSDMNVFQLSDQHDLMKRLFFPASFPKCKRFNLTAGDYDFLYSYMSKYPTESDFPKYDLPYYYPTYCKFLFYGADENIKPNPNIRIFNKVGDAYGYSLDNIYLIDYETKVEFILTAVIQSNDDEIYNDNTYEYETVSYPFLKNLGQKVYDFELQRSKKHQPNFKELLKYK